jgi:hypothetical protein
MVEISPLAESVSAPWSAATSSMATNVFSLPQLFLKKSQSAPDMLIGGRSALVNGIAKKHPGLGSMTGHAVVNSRSRAREQL